MLVRPLQVGVSGNGKFLPGPRVLLGGAEGYAGLVAVEGGVGRDGLWQVQVDGDCHVGCHRGRYW